MKIVIDISENQYEIAKEFIKTVDDKSPLANAIVNGIPLPKGHGRLIDADALTEDYKCYWETEYEVNNAPTIIEADKAESEV